VRFKEGTINQSFTTNSRRIATPSPRAFPGNHHATPIMFRMVRAALLLSVYLYVSRTEAFFMASNTSYLKQL
jgi:hypothetical protein